MSMKTALSAIALLCVGFAAPVWAQAPAQPEKAPTAPAAPVDDQEDAFDEKLRELGYWSGAAYGCVPVAKQAEVERKVMDTFHNVARLFGTDRAFFFAAAFGHGTTVKVEAEKCAVFLERFEKATALRDGK